MTKVKLLVRSQAQFTSPKKAKKPKSQVMPKALRALRTVTTNSSSMSLVTFPTIPMSAQTLVTSTIQGSNHQIRHQTRMDSSATSAQSTLLKKNYPLMFWARVKLSCFQIPPQVQEGSPSSTLAARPKSPSSAERLSSLPPMAQTPLLPVESLASERTRYSSCRPSRIVIEVHEPDGEWTQYTSKACSC